MANRPPDRLQRRGPAYLVSAAACLVATAGCRPGPQPIPAPAPPSSARKEGFTIEGGSTVFKDSRGKTLWQVSAKQVNGQITEGRVSMQDARCLLYSQGKPEWRCRAASISADKPTESVRMEGGVSGASVDGERAFRVPGATWNVKTGALEGGPRVWLRLGNAQITGDRLIANTNSNTGKVVGHARGRIFEKRG